MACTTCHDPHDRAGALPSVEAERDLCGACHDLVTFGYDRHSALGCSSCHSVHGGHGRELLARPAVDEVCTRCHVGGGGIPSAGLEVLADRRGRLFGATPTAPAPAGHLTPPEGRCVDCHPIHE
jgi:predicted CXXCH cytochrome family protein